MDSSGSFRLTFKEIWQLHVDFLDTIRRLWARIECCYYHLQSRFSQDPGNKQIIIASDRHYSVIFLLFAWFTNVKFSFKILPVFGMQHISYSGSVRKIIHPVYWSCSSPVSTCTETCRNLLRCGSIIDKHTVVVFTRLIYKLRGIIAP